MKRWWWYIIIPSVLLLGFVAFRLVITDGKSSSEQAFVFSDSLMSQLPEDDKLAQKELEKARAALVKIKPSKPYIVIDSHANLLSLRTEDTVLFKGICSTGSGGELVDSLTGRRWSFNTPRECSKSPASWSIPGGANRTGLSSKKANPFPQIRANDWTRKCWERLPWALAMIITFMARFTSDFWVSVLLTVACVLVWMI